MSKPVHELLKHYHELNTTDPESGIIDVREDINRALSNAPLTDEEVTVLRALFLLEPIRPERYEAAGRPRGGSTQSYIAQIMLDAASPNAANIRIHRTVKRACQKLADYLGGDYLGTA